MQNAVSKSSNSLRVSNIVVFALTILVNGIAGSTTLLGGRNTAMVSDTYFTLVTPAGYVFSIWGVIYILLGIFVAFQALDRNQGKQFQKKLDGYSLLALLLTLVGYFFGSTRTFRYLSQ
jgi:benzodiazapine receptor